MDEHEIEIIRKQLNRNIKRLIDSIDSHEKVTTPMQLIPESPIHTSFDGAVKMAIEGFEYSAQHWIDWFIYENDMGKKGHEAGFDGVLKSIKTVEQLVELIIEGMNRNG